jgi:protein O-GlcNAc transferase
MSSLLAKTAIWIGIFGIAGAVAAQPRDRALERAERLIQQGAPDQAASVLREVVSQQPDNADAHLLLGRALALSSQVSDAIKALRRAVELRPGSSPAHYALGTALARFGDLDGARAAFEKTLVIDPASADAHVSLALLCAQRADVGCARAHLVRAIDVQGESAASAYSHYLMAQLLRQEQKPEAALQYLDLAIKRRPDYAEAHLSRGLLKTELREESAAREAFETAVRLAPDDPVAQSELGGAYLRESNAQGAIVHFERTLRLKPGDRRTLYKLCRAYQLAGRSQDATRCFEKVSSRVQAESGRGDLAAAEANARGLELERHGNIAAALEEYRTAVALSPSPVLRRNMALALCRLGQWDECIEELQKVLEVAPDDQDAIRALHLAKEQAAKAREP